LQALLPGFRLFFGAAVDEFGADGRRQRFGNLIATRLPVARVQHHPLPWPADPSVTSMPRMCSVVTLSTPEFGAVRVMTTHLEYYSPIQRMAQAEALRALHVEACAQAARPPVGDDRESPFQAKTHTPHAIVCGDFNMAATDPAYAAMLLAPAVASPAAVGAIAAPRLRDAWPVVHGDTPHAPTFRLFDRTYGPDPVACDFVFVSEGLAPHVRRIEVDLATRASDHQPVFVAFG
jgi:endonuclease/exonuclease/phosphatase family metal-dependent hydrolase